MSNFEKLRKWVNNSEFSSVYDEWMSNGSKKIVDRTNEYSEGTLYRLELKDSSSQLNGCLLYCAKNHKGKVNWTTFSRVGNKACEVYTNGRDSKSGIFYCLLTKEQFNDLNKGTVTSGNPLIKKVVVTWDEANSASDLGVGDAIVFSARTEEHTEDGKVLGGYVYVKEGEGEWEFVCSIHDRKTFVVSKTYQSVEAMNEDIYNFDDVEYYDFVLTRMTDEQGNPTEDYAIYQKFVVVEDGATKPLYQIMGVMKDAFFIAEFHNKRTDVLAEFEEVRQNNLAEFEEVRQNNLAEFEEVRQSNVAEFREIQREVEEDRDDASESRSKAFEYMEESKENKEVSTDAREHIEEIANLVDELHDEVLEDNNELRNEFTETLRDALIEEIKDSIKTEILDELSDTQSISVMVPSVNEDGSIGWELKHFTSKEEADEALAEIKRDEGLMGIIDGIQEQIDAKFGDARVTDDYELYFYANASDSDSEDVCGPITGIGGAGGGSGGGTGGNNAVLTVSNRTGWATATIADGSKCNITFTWSSIEEGFSTGPGALSIKVGGVTYVASAPIQNGATITRDISSYLTAGTKNKVVVEVSDCYGNKKTLRFTVQVVALKITSTFDPYESRSQEFDIRVTPTGDASKVMHYVIDGDYDTIVARLQNLNNAYKLVGKKPKAEEGVTYYTFDETTNTYTEYPMVEVGETVMGGYYTQDPITYTACGEGAVVEKDIQYYEAIDGGFIAVERPIIGSSAESYFTQDEITYTLLVEEDSVAEEGVQYYELITNTVGENTNTYYVKKEVVVGETVVNDYYTCLYEYGGTELNQYTVKLSDDRGTIIQEGLPTTSNGTPLTQKIGEQTHGAHTIDIWFESVIEGAIASSNLLHYEFAYLVDGESTPILITQFTGSEIEQYETIMIPFKVFTPNSEETSRVDVYVNDLVEEGSEDYTTAYNTYLNVMREVKNFTYRADHIVELGTDSEGNPITENGWVKIRFVVGGTLLTRDFHIVVTPCTIVVNAVTENLDFYLTSNCGKSNGSSGYTDWSYNGIGAQFTDFTWTSDGWQQDAQGYPVMRLLADARIFIPFYPFQRDFGSSGETIEIEFSTSNIYNYDTPIISCWDDVQQRGFEVTSQRFTFKTQLTQISTQFKEDEHVRVSFTISESRGDRIIACYLNGVMSGAVQYDKNNDFSQSTPQGISIGCNDATVDIYNIRFYSRGLSRDEVVTNWIADTFDGLTKKIRFEHNDIFDEGYNITPDTLPEDLPYMIISPLDGISTFEEGMPNAKGDTHQIHGEYHDIQHPEYSFEFNSLIDVQGSSSQFYPRKNYEIKLKKATTPYVKYFEKSEAESKPRYKLRDSSVATSTFTFKADYASSEGANNVELTKLYNDLQKNVIWKTPRQQDAEGKGDTTDYRIGIDGYPMAVFYRVGNDTKFIGKYNFNNSKGTPEVYGFDFYEDENNPTGYPIESWETLNNVSNRVIWKSDDFEGDAWASDFEARYMDEIPSYKRTTDTAPVEGKQYFYKDASTNLYIKFGYVWNNVVMKFIPSGSQTPTVADMPNLYEPIMDDDEQAVEVNTNTTALHALATWLKSVDTGNILNSAMKPTTTPSYAVTMNFREKTVADGGNVCGLYTVDDDKMVLVGQTHPVMDDPTALYAELVEGTGTYNPVNVQLGDDVTGLYLISNGLYIEQVATDTLAKANTTYYSYDGESYEEVEDVEVGVTVVNDYYIGYVGTHEKQLITNAMAIKEDGVTYYEAYDFKGVEFDEPITLTYNTYQYDSSNTGDYNKIPVTETFTEDNVAYRQAKFKVEFEEHFHKSTTLFYYLFTEIFLMVDSRAKNAFATTWDGQHWSWVPYDMDTAIGINNEGALEFGYDLEDYMYVGPNGEGIVIPTANSANVYNGAESVLWRNIRDCFYEELAMLYKNLRNVTVVGSGESAKRYTLSYAEVERRFEDHQSKWPEKLVNEDSYFKYIEPLLYNAEDYLEMLQGLKAEQRKWWLYNRFRYMDAKYFAGDAKDNTITFRSYNAGTFQITPYADIYARVRAGNYIVSARAPRNVTTSLHAGQEITNDLETAIYSADQLKSVGDLSVFAPGWCNISMATKLQELKVGGAIDNDNFTQLTLGNNTLLRKIIATHLPKLEATINATGCTSLEEAYFEASGISALNLPNGGILRILHLPDTITRLEIQNQTHITDFEVSSASGNANVYRNISDLVINNASTAVYEQLDEIIGQMASGSRVRLLNTPLHFEGQTTTECWSNFEAFIASLSHLRGIDSDGNTVDNAVVTGDVLLDNVEYATFNETVDVNNQYIIETESGETAVAYRGKDNLVDYRFKYANCKDTVNWVYNNGVTETETHYPVHTWVGEEENWSKTPISAITPTTDAPSIEVPTRTSTSNHVEEGDIVDYAFEYAGWTREVVEGNVNGDNTYIVRGEEDVIEAESGESYPVVKDETFTAVYKAHPIYYVNFYDRADRNGNAETGDSDVRLVVEEGEPIPYVIARTNGRLEVDYKNLTIYDGTNRDWISHNIVFYDWGGPWSPGTLAYDAEKDVLYYPSGRSDSTRVLIDRGNLNNEQAYLKGTPTYEKSYVDGTYSTERLGEVPSITVPVADPLDWRTNFNDNTIGQDEFERVQDYQYYFKGWTRNANTTIYNYGEDTPEDFFADGEALTVEGNTNFYAVYEKHAIYYADFYDVVGDTGNKLLYTACMIDGVDGESIGAYEGETALTKAYNDHNHVAGDSTFGYTYYFDGFKEGKEKFIYDLHEGRIESEAEGTRTATLDIDGIVGVIHENKKFYTVYEARQTYYIAFFNEGVCLHENKNVLGFSEYEYTGSGTRESVDNSHERGDAQFGYNFYHRGWNDSESDLTYDLTLTEDATVDGRPVRHTACNEFTTTFSNLDGNRNFYEVFEAKQVYYLNFKSWNGEAYLGEENSFEIGSLGNDSGIPTSRVDYGTHVVDDDNSTYKFEFGGWSLTAVDSEDELVNNHTVAYPTEVTGYDYAEGATNIVLNGNTILYGMYQSRKAYYVSFHDHEGNLLSANSESTLWEGETITWDGDESALARATTNDHATDSSAVDYQYDFVGWNTEQLVEWVFNDEDLFKVDAINYGIIIPDDVIIPEGATSFSIKGGSYSENMYKDASNPRKFTFSRPSEKPYRVRARVNGSDEFLQTKERVTELNPTYSNSSVTYQAPSYYKKNVIGANTDHNIKLYATYQKRPIYYVNFYDWDETGVATPISGGMTVNWGKCGGTEDVIVTYGEDEGLWIPKEFLAQHETAVGSNETGLVAKVQNGGNNSPLYIHRLPQDLGKWLYDNAESVTEEIPYAYNQDYWGGWKLWKGIATYQDMNIPLNYNNISLGNGMGVGIRTGADLKAPKGSRLKDYEGNHVDTVENILSTTITSLLNDNDYYLVQESGEPEVNNDAMSIVISNLSPREVYLRHWNTMRYIPDTVNKGVKYKLSDAPISTVHSTPYLEGGATSTTSKDMTSASASGTCTYTRAEIPMVNVSLTRDNTEHHSLSDTSANDYNYTYYGWDTALPTTGDNASAYRSESMPNTVKAKTGNLGFVNANTSFYAVYEQKNIYYVDFYNTASGGTPTALTVDWGTYGGEVTYEAGEGLWIPRAFLLNGTSSIGTQFTEPSECPEVGYCTWFGVNDCNSKEERQIDSSSWVNVYKLPNNLGKYLYDHAETWMTGEMVYGSDSTARSYPLYRGVAVYPDTCDWSDPKGIGTREWGVGIRKKEDLLQMTSKGDGTGSEIGEQNHNYSCCYNYPEYQKLDDNGYYLVLQLSSSSTKFVNKLANDDGADHLWFRTWKDVNTEPNANNKGSKYTYEVYSPFCAKGYVEGTSAGTLTSTTNVARTLGTTTEPTKASEELFNYTYTGWSEQSNDCIYDHVSDNSTKTWEFANIEAIGTLTANKNLYATFRKEKRVFLDLFNLGTQVGTRQEITSSVTAPSESLLSREQSILHEAGNGEVDQTYAFMGWNSARGTDEWSDTGMIAKASLTGSLVQAGATANTIGGILASGYDDSTHVVTLHAMWKGEKIFYLDFYDAKVTDGTPVYPTSATVNDFNYQGSISFNENKTILSGEAPVLNAPSSDMYADYTLEGNYSTDSVSNVTLEQIMDRCLPFQGSVDVNLTPEVTSYGWTNTDVVAPEGYDIYMSGNYHVASSNSVCKLTFHNCTECDIYIRSYAESTYDYTIASQVNASSYPTSTSGAKAHTRGNQKSGTTLADYTKVSYTGLNEGDYVYIVYVKDGSGDQGDDRGYVLIPKKGIGGSSANVWKSITPTYKTYTINLYDSGDGTVDVSTPMSTLSSNYMKTFTTPTGSGYATLDQDMADMYGEFLGWTDAPWDGVSQNVLTDLKCTGNMNLYAVYRNNYVGTRALIERNITGDLTCSATTVGEYAFSDLDGLEYINLTNVTSIGAHAFENDANLVMVDIQTSNCVIDSTAFDGCYSLEEIRVPVGSLTYYQTALGGLGVTITEHAWSDLGLDGWLNGTIGDVSNLETPTY